MSLAVMVNSENHNKSLIDQQKLDTQSAYSDDILNFSFVSQKTQLESTARFKSLLYALPAGVVVVNGNGQVDECNPAAIALLGEPLLGESWRNVIERAFNPMPSGQDMLTIKGRIVNISTCPLGNDISGQIILLQDVTTNRELQSQLDQQKRLATMGQMAAQLAHQIRTPISSALLYASHLKKSNLSESNRLKFADKILNRIKSLENLIKDMLLFSKNGVEQGSLEDVGQFFDKIEQAVISKEKTHIEFSNSIDTQHTIFSNQNLLLSALLNLIDNAEQSVDLATKKVADIKVILTQREKGYVDFIIKDNGQGINKKDLHQIYEPFYTTKSQGTGLGLAVVKAICHGHQGELWLEQTSSKGSSFVVRLPISKKQKIT